MRWTLQVQLAGQMPSLPSQNSSLRAALMASRDYIDALVVISDTLGGWIEDGQRQGAVNTKLPPLAVLYTLYARACDPVVEFLRAGGQHGDSEIVELVHRHLLRRPERPLAARLAPRARGAGESLPARPCAHSPAGWPPRGSRPTR